MTVPIPELLAQRPLRLGTRQSPLAMAQAHEAAARLVAAHGLQREQIQLCPVVASGDKILDRALAEIGGKALWTKELDASLANRDIDFSVHSMKDVETIRPDIFVIAAMPPRADVRDCLIGADSIAAIRRDGIFGTSSPRRAAQMKALRPDLETLLFRGNVATRLAKLAAGEADATLLAAAGLHRLGIHDTGTSLDVDDWLPAPSQGAIGIECRADDVAMREFLAAIDHAPTSTCVVAERALLAALGGDCQSAISALAVIDGDKVWLRAMLYAPDGAARVEADVRFAPDDADAPARMAHDLLSRSPPDIRRLFAA